ncbi:MAG: BatA and WFA domain-containing protein [Planctomycetes bacterium]|nr:BatA and WFA domain-containing protein [Planctomycetota bacterium]
MTFLAPIPAIVATAVAVPALLVFYFLRLKRLPVRVSSTMLWEDAAHDLQVNVPLRWLRPSWMLLLQLIALGLLLGALGRPAVRMDAAAGERLVIIIDRSASMNARDASGVTRLDRATTRAAELVREAARAGSRVMLVVFATTAEVPVGFTSDTRRLVRAIESIEPTDGHGDLRAALSLVSAAGANETSETATPEWAGTLMDVVLLSDGVFDETEPLHVPGARVRYESMSAVEGGDRQNVSIDALSASRDPNRPGVVRAFVRLASTRHEPVSTTLTLDFEGVVFERRVVDIPAAMGDGSPGEASLTLRLNELRAGVLRVSIDAADALRADNNAAVVLPPAGRPSVLLVHPDGEGAGQGAVWLIADVLEELSLSGVQVVGASEGESMRRDGRIGRFGLVVYDRVSPVRLVPTPSLSFGATLPIDGFTARVNDGPTRVLSWRRTDDLLRDVSLDALVVAETATLVMDRDAERQMTTLARGADGPMIVRLEGATPRVVVGFDIRQSTWPLSPGFSIFLSNVVETLAVSGGGEGRSYSTGEVVVVAVPTGWRRLDLEGPVSLGIGRDDVPGAGERVSLGVLERVGVYRMSVDGEPIAAVAVNLDSRTERMLGGVDAVTIGGENLASTGGGAEPREVWHWFVLGAMVILTCEWLLNAAQMRV